MAATDPARRPGSDPNRVAAAGDGLPCSADASTCPLCGGPNECVLGDERLKDDTCWCVGHRFSDKLFAQVPAADLGRRCVCQHCAFGVTAS